MKTQFIKVLKKHYFFVPLNVISIGLLLLWLYKICSTFDTSVASILIDFTSLVTCFYSVVRVSQSLNGNFNLIDMITVYYGSLFFMFVWFVKCNIIAFDHFYTNQPDHFKLIVSVIVFLTFISNFYITEKVNMHNLDKIDSL